MNYMHQTTEWQSMIPPKRPSRARQRNSDTRRRQEEEDIDDRPMMPVRSSAIVETDDGVTPLTDLYLTVSNLERNGVVAVGLPLNATTNQSNATADNRKPPPTYAEPNRSTDYEEQQQNYHQLPSPPPRRSQVAAIPPDWNSSVRFDESKSRAASTNNRRPRQRPQTVTVPQRGLRRCLSAVTMSSDLVSFDGSEFAAIPPVDDYMDDDQLQEYLDQLAKEEDRKSRERESLKNELFAASAVNAREREMLKELLRHLDCGAGASNAEGDYDAYLDRLVEEQMQAEEQCMSSVARRVSDMSI